MTVALSAAREALGLGDMALNRVMKMSDQFSVVIDVGGGDGRHAKAFAMAGKKVILVDINPSIASGGNLLVVHKDYMQAQMKPADLIFCCHCLEHQPNVNDFLKKVYFDLVDDGILVIVVPPAKHQIVSGHLTIWNAGLVLYNLVMAGFDCKNAMVLAEGYNISVIVKKRRLDMPDLKWDFGDLTKLRPHFPDGLAWGQDSFNGDIAELNWH